MFCFIFSITLFIEILLNRKRVKRYALPHRLNILVGQYFSQGFLNLFEELTKTCHLPLQRPIPSTCRVMLNPRDSGTFQTSFSCLGSLNI